MSDAHRSIHRRIRPLLRGKPADYTYVRQLILVGTVSNQTAMSETGTNSVKQIEKSPDDGALGGAGPDPSTRSTDVPAGSSFDPEAIATALCVGYERHDSRDRAGAIDAFTTVDRAQFSHLTASEARDAATALVDALWAKDRLEETHVIDGRVHDPDGLAAADWCRVEDPLRRRANIVGMDEEFASLTTEGWRRHKIGGDYETCFLAAQRLKVEAVLGTETYPEKERAGRSGTGELPARYLVAVELHDCRTQQARDRTIEIMTPYFETILGGSGGNE